MHKLATIILLQLVSIVTWAQGKNGVMDTAGKKSVELSSFTVKADRLSHDNNVSEITIDQQTLKTNHGLMEDPMRVISMMPGVARGGDLFSPSQIYIRGGAPEENLFLNNNAKLYFPYYFGGQKSVFNSDVVEDVQLFTGGFPAKYGNALSSVLSVTTRDGKKGGYAGLFSFGFYNSALLAEGPIGKNASFLVAARKTYLDLFLDESAEFPVPNFGDITYKLSLFDSGKHKITLSGFSGYEQMDFLVADPEPGVPDRLKTKGNAHTQSLQWHYAHKNVYSKLSLVNTLQNNKNIVGRNLDLKINGRETGIREDLNVKLNSKIKLQTGFEGYHNNIVFNSTLPRDPRDFDPTDTSVVLNKLAYNEDYVLFGTWLSANTAISKRIGLTAGLRYDLLNKNQLGTLAPRLSAYYSIQPETELRLAYTHNYQFPSTEVLTANSNINVPGCTHYIAGLHHEFKKGIGGWIELYYKDYKDLVTYDTAFNYGNSGSGYAQGAELFFNKSSGNFTGWVSYAFSVARRRSNLDDKEYYFDFDQRHIGNLSLQYQVKRKARQWYLPTVVNTQLRVESGRPYTPVQGAVKTPGGWQQLKGDINSRREKDYLNVNLRVEWQLKNTKHLSITSYIEVWNLLNRKNILGRTYQYGAQYSNNVHVLEYYSTSILPAGGLRMAFF